MAIKIYKYSFTFADSIPAQELEGTFKLAKLAIESLHGQCQALEESKFYLDRVNRICVIDASTDAGNDLDRVFTAFAIEEYGDHSVKIERIIC